MKIYDPILVVGSGRCGTSAVSSILYHLGIFMGHAFVEANSTNKWGHWEDKEFHGLNVSLFGGKMIEQQWSFGTEKLIIDRRAMMRPWGFKDPRTADLLPQYLYYFKKPLFVWCRRKHVDIEVSMKKAYGWSKEIAQKTIKRREDNIKKHSSGHKLIEIEFDNILKNKEKEIEKILFFINQEHLKNANELIQGS